MPCVEHSIKHSVTAKWVTPAAAAAVLAMTLHVHLQYFQNAWLAQSHPSAQSEQHTMNREHHSTQAGCCKPAHNQAPSQAAGWLLLHTVQDMLMQSPIAAYMPARLRCWKQLPQPTTQHHAVTNQTRE
jgi:hypothetical protein